MQRIADHTALFGIGTGRSTVHNMLYGGQKSEYVFCVWRKCVRSRYERKILSISEQCSFIRSVHQLRYGMHSQHPPGLSSDPQKTLEQIQAEESTSAMQMNSVFESGM
jgi:hypothetical protein